MLFRCEISKDEPALSHLGGTVFLLAHTHGHSCSGRLSLNVKGVEKKKKKRMNPRKRLPRYAEGRRPCIKTVSAHRGAQSSQGSEPTDCTFVRALGGVAASAALSEPVGVCCPHRLQQAEHCSLPEESLSSPS